jgi:hypothetical protein
MIVAKSFDIKQDLALQTAGGFYFLLCRRNPQNCIIQGVID